MKFLDFTSLFDTEAANLAILSTFQLDADFFERRLLRCPALVKARRILIFMDAGQWFKLLRQDVRAGFVNRRYLVVPIRPPQGVFHPKLNLLISESLGHVQCGSNNLTRSGCSSNLELLNSFFFDLGEGHEEAFLIAQEAYAFFKRACDDAEKETGRIARQWLDELPVLAPWLRVRFPERDNRRVRLIHTYEGSLWDRLTIILDASPPQKLIVISPFYDGDGEMVKRVRHRWPKCQIELVVQQQTTNLPLSPLKKLRNRVNLSALRNSSRRLHAKLVAWESSNESGCLVGSANFTTAAFDSRNVETCLLVSEAKDYIKSLFDKELGKKPIAFEDFEPGSEQEPGTVDESANLRLLSALLSTDAQLRVAYRHCLKTMPSKLRVAIRTPGEQRARALLNVPNKESGTATLGLPETALMEAHGTILASLVAEIGDHHEESLPIWVIQEGRLTYEPNGEGPTSPRAKVEETGEGLIEFLEELGKRDGVSAVIEYLRCRNIRFYDGGRDSLGQKKFRIRIHDPFHPDVAPEWLLQIKTDNENLSAAIYAFVDRHEKQRFRRHAKRGNINGMENFLDVFTALIRLLYVYHVRGVVDRPQLIHRLCKYLEVATAGFEEQNDSSEGYLQSLSDNLNGANDYLQEVCNELNFLGHLHAALVIVQKIRFVPGEQVKWGTPPNRPSECLPTTRDLFKNTMEELGLNAPSKQEVMKALEEYRMFTPAELVELEKGIVV